MVVPFERYNHLAVPLVDFVPFHVVPFQDHCTFTQMVQYLVVPFAHFVPFVVPFQNRSFFRDVPFVKDEVHAVSHLDQSFCHYFKRQLCP